MQAAELVDKLVAAQDAADDATAKAVASGGGRRRGGRGRGRTAGQEAEGESQGQGQGEGRDHGRQRRGPGRHKALHQPVRPRRPRASRVRDRAGRAPLHDLALYRYRIENTTPTTEKRAQRLVTTEVID